MIFASCSPSSNFSVGGFGTLLSLQRLLKTGFDKSLTNPLDRLPPTAEGFGDPAVAPSRTVRIGLQQNLGTSHLLAAAFELLDDLPQRLAFLLRQADNILLLHGTPPCSPQFPKKPPLRPIPIFSCDKALAAPVELASDLRLLSASAVHLGYNLTLLQSKMMGHRGESVQKGFRKPPYRTSPRCFHLGPVFCPSLQFNYDDKRDWIDEEAPSWRQWLRRGGRPPEKRGKLTDCVRIDGRPEVINRRRRYGDWEGDTMVGKGRRNALVTLVERKSGYARIGLAENLKAETTRQVTVQRMKDLPASLRRSVTFDNGKEFAEHEQLSRSLNLEVYFALPYRSWQRGTNENTNGLLRQFFPKGTDFSRISHHEVARVETLLNERPRKRLGYRTPAKSLKNDFVAIES